MARGRRDSNTLDLLSWEPPRVAVGYDAQETRGPLDLAIARLVSAALKRAAEAKKSREQIAEDMSAFLGRPVSKATLDTWSSPARSSNRIPLDAFAALIEATGDHDLLGFLPAQHGYVVVPEKYADLIELHLIEEKEAEIARRKAALTARYKGGRS
ncbi:hypothetical protein [Xanthobacter flavus]|uniref:hypothetical protein n=1 Tax=Xanthobacter flavus TaxID=281 RepID=UPI003729676D